jgi:hypothetical protein
MRPKRQSNDCHPNRQFKKPTAFPQNKVAMLISFSFLIICSAMQGVDSVCSYESESRQELLMASKPIHIPTQAPPCTLSNIFVKEERNLLNLLDQTQNCREYKLLPYLGFQFLGSTIMNTESPENAAQTFLQTFPSL